MAEITSLSTIGKDGIGLYDYLVVANKSTKKARKLLAQSLFPTLLTSGSGGESLYVSVTNRNQINLKGLTSADATKLTVTTASNNLVLTILEAGLDLSKMINTTSNFMSSVEFSRGVSGLLGISNGGTGLTSITKGHVLYANAANTITTTGLTTHGQLLIGNTTTGYPQAGNITSSDSSITVTNGAGSIDLKVAATSLLASHLDASSYNINLNASAGTSFLTGDGSNEGLTIDTAGRVFVGDSTPTVPTLSAGLTIGGSAATALEVGNVNAWADKTIKFKDSASGVAGMNGTIKGSSSGGGGTVGGNLTVEAGKASTSGKGGDLILAGGDYAAGSAGNVIIKTYGSSGSLGTALTVAQNGQITHAQNATFTKQVSAGIIVSSTGLASATGVVAPSGAKSQITNGYSGALTKNTHYLAPADGNAITATLPGISSSALGDTIIVEYTVGINNGETHKYGTSTEMFEVNSTCYRMNGATGSAVGLIQTVDVANGSSDDFLNLIGLTNAGPGIGSIVKFTFNGSRWRAEAKCTSSGTGAATNASVFAAT